MPSPKPSNPPPMVSPALTIPPPEKRIPPVKKGITKPESTGPTINNTCNLRNQSPSDGQGFGGGYAVVAREPDGAVAKKTGKKSSAPKSNKPQNSNTAKTSLAKPDNKRLAPKLNEQLDSKRAKISLAQPKVSDTKWNDVPVEVTLKLPGNI